MPELQGRLPVRVQLQGLSEKDLLKILTGPKCSLTKQYMELMATEGVQLTFEEAALKQIGAHAQCLAAAPGRYPAPRPRQLSHKVAPLRPVLTDVLLLLAAAFVLYAARSCFSCCLCRGQHYG